MIISASRRTDIPAFYAGWLLDCLRAGYVNIRNPFSPKQSRNIILSPELIKGIVFWTKFPNSLMSRLKDLDSFGYPYYFQYTITAYENDLEAGLPSKGEVVNMFRALSSKIGSERIIWRYDPILITSSYTVNDHIETFKRLCKDLEGFTKRCIISFYTPYRKCIPKLRHLEIFQIHLGLKMNLLEILSQIASNSKITVSVCADSDSYEKIGILPSRCIDNTLINLFQDQPIPYTKDKNQRKACQCSESVDIGNYGTCRFGCLYCYAS